MSSILSISISPNRNTVSEDDLREYYKVLKPYLEKNSSRYVITMEKGKRDFLNHIQCVCETTINKESMRQYLNRHMKDLPGYSKGKGRGVNDGSTVCVINRTKNGTAMFAYPMKESEKLVCDIKGISEQEMEHFCEEFAKLPDMKTKKDVVTNKSRRDSFKNVEVGTRIIWDSLPKKNCQYEKYLERPKYRGDDIEVVEYIKTRPDGTKYIQKQKEYLGKKQISHEMVDIPNTELPDVSLATRKYCKEILLRKALEMKDTTLANTYMKHYDLIRMQLQDIHEKWEKYYVDKFYGIYDEASSIDELEEEESTLGDVLSDNEEEADEFVRES